MLQSIKTMLATTANASVLVKCLNIINIIEYHRAYLNIIEYRLASLDIIEYRG